MPLGIAARGPGSMGRAAARASGSTSSTASSSLDPATDPTFFLRYLGEDGDRQAAGGRGAPATASPATSRASCTSRARSDDVIISAGYRIGPFEVESALVAHPAVAEAAVVAAPDEERGAVVRAVVVLRDGHAPSDALARELQDHVKAETAPYKYPRVVDFADELPQDRQREGPPRAAARGDNRTSIGRPARVALAPMSATTPATARSIASASPPSPRASATA